MELYWLLFCDVLLANIIFFPHEAVAYQAMLVFGQHTIPNMITIAILSSILGATINYSLGYCVHFLKLKFNWPDSDKLKQLSLTSNKYLVYFCFFSFLPIWGLLLTAVSGFLRLNYLKMIAALVMGKLFYYMFYL